MTLTNQSLILSSSLVLIALIFSYTQKLKMEKDIIISISRAIIQLLIVGSLLNYIFNLKNVIITTVLILIMILNAAHTSSGRAKKIKNSFYISVIAISISSIVTITTLVATGSIQYIPSQVIPISGMIIGNSMVAIGLVFKNIIEDFKKLKDEIEAKLSLGADKKTASIEIIKNSIKTGMTPTIDSAKTLGIVSLPGMMSGLILAGVSPINAVKYQIMVTFMLVSTTSIASFTAAFIGYRSFFNDRDQLILDNEDLD